LPLYVKDVTITLIYNLYLFFLQDFNLDGFVFLGVDLTKSSIMSYLCLEKNNNQIPINNSIKISVISVK